MNPTGTTRTTASIACPDCGQPLTGEPRCRHCGLTLTGDDAARLWDVDQELLHLDGLRIPLLAERRVLVQRLRTQLGVHADEPAGRREWTPRRVQNLLLTLGAGLLALAAVVFAAVTYDRLGAGGRAGVLVALAITAAAVGPVLLRRGLTATAEAAGAVGVVLALLAAGALRRAGLGDDLEPSTFWALATAACAAAAALYARLAPIRLVALGAVLLAQLPLPLLAATDDARIAMALAAVVVLDAAGLAVLRRTPNPRWRTELARVSAVSALIVAGWAMSLALEAGYDVGDQRGPAVLAVLAIVAGVLSWDVRSRPQQEEGEQEEGEPAGRLDTYVVRLVDPAWLLAASVVPLAGLAAHAAAFAETGRSQLLAPVGVGLLAAVLLAVARPGPWRKAAVTGTLALSTVALFVVGERVVDALLGWLLRSGSTVADARTAWLVVALTAVTVAVCRGQRAGRLAAGALATVAVLLLPVAWGLTYDAGLAVLLGCAALLVAGAHAFGERSALIVGAAVVICFVGMSSGFNPASQVALPMAALIGAAAAAARAGDAVRGWVAAAAGVLTGLAAAVHADAPGWSDEHVGVATFATAAALVALTRLLRGTRRVGVEVAATAVGVYALFWVTYDVGWLSWLLAGSGVLALLVALQPDRRPVAAAGGLLLAASSWVRLADADVTAPEPYVVPLGLVVLALGVLRRRTAPSTGSLAAYGPGLSLLLVPSLLKALDDNDLTRPLLLGAAALVVLLVGARQRLRAPLLFGGVVLALDALHLTAPYAAALPRWVALAFAGAVLLTLGATYEQRRRDLGRLRERYAELA